MVDYQIQPNSRQCCVSGRPLQPGETCYSVLMVEEAKLVRKDYSREAWQGPPAGAVGHWLSKVQAADRPKRLAIDPEMLFDCFVRLEAQTEPARVNFRYVLALLLMRRKRLKFEETRTADGHEVLRLRCSQTRTIHEVVNPSLSDEAIQAVQDEVFKVLGWQ
jgi:hypothetical protein